MDHDPDLRKAMTSRAISIEEVREFRQSIGKHVEGPFRIVFIVLYFVIVLPFQIVGWVLANAYGLMLIATFGLIGYFAYIVFGVLN